MTHPYVPPQPGGPGAYEQQLTARARQLEEENLQLRRDRESLETDLGTTRRLLAEARQDAERWEQARDQECMNTAAVFHEYYRRWQSTIVEARRQCARADAAEAAFEQIAQVGHAVWQQLQRAEARP